ncbi:hypothetical protein [Chlamydia sp. 17-3921]|uniref:hypothetical protein n=1 Tax=Chlamydia sp. 17-3921 TaxID=2675798 RepID=UPI001918795C|nr:hypothetical protein [Chlamydia sp. 17-3921]
MLIPSHNHAISQDRTQQVESKSISIPYSMKPPSGCKFIPLTLPLVGLVYAVCLYRKAKQDLKIISSELGYTPQATCHNKQCKILAKDRFAPVVVAVFGGLGLLLPVLLIITLVNMIKALICHCRTHCGFSKQTKPHKS